VIEKLLRHRWGFPLALLAAALLGAGGYALIQTLVPAAARDRAQIERVVRNYLLEHPEILPEAMERLNAREAAKASAAALAALNADRDTVQRPFPGAESGNPQGDVTVVAFLDYNCPYCHQTVPAIAELVRRDPKVRIVYREYAVLGEESVTAARWALAAAQQGKFKPFHDALYSSGRANEANVAAAARVAGLNLDIARQAAGSKAVEAEILGNHKIGERLGMTGTPAWVVGNQILNGVQGYEALAQAVAAARAGK
jgi:protein-disulfide isomerase